jgi:hypothetical protein
MTVSRTVQLLQQATPIPVYILPGNHDMLDTGSVYLREAFAPGNSGNIIVLREPTPVSISEAYTLFPCPVTARTSLHDPTAWIPHRANTSIRIGVAHGGVTTIRQDFDYPISLDTADARELDYLALGDWHGMVVYDGNRMAYPGTPEQTSFGEDGTRTGHVLLVTIEQNGATPIIAQRPVGTLRWHDKSHELRMPVADGIRAIMDDIIQCDDGPQTLLRLSLTGTVPANEVAAIEQLSVWLAARCANGELLHAEQRVSIRTTEQLSGALRESADSEPILAAAIANLQRLASPDGAAEPCGGQTAHDLMDLLEWWKQTNPPPEIDPAGVAARALAMLAEMAVEVR